MKAARAIAVGFACLVLALTARAADEKSKDEKSKVDAAIEQSQKTGRPILAVAGSKTCAPCQALKGQLHNDKSLQPLLSQFVPLEMSTDDDDPSFGTWYRKYPQASNGIPFVWVVRADGEKLYADSGPPADLPKFLAEHLQQSGKPLSDKQAATVSDAVAAANELVGSGKFAPAVLKVRPYLNLGSYAKPAVDAEGVVKTVTEKLQASVDEAGKKAATSDEALDGAVTLVEASRLYSKSLPPIAKSVNEKLNKLRKSPDKRDIVKQAELVDKANLMAAKTPAKALAMFQSIAEKHPDTPAAKLAEEKIKELEESGVTKPGGGEKLALADRPAAKTKDAPASEIASSDTAAKPASSAEAKKLASYLKLAKMYAAKKPEKAREYIQKIVDAAPDSPEATEAQALLAE